MQKSILSSILPLFLTGVTVKAVSSSSFYIQYADGQCQNPIVAYYYNDDSYYYEDQTCFAFDRYEFPSGTNPIQNRTQPVAGGRYDGTRLYISTGSLDTLVTFDEYPNIDNGAVAVGGYWGSEDCQGDPIYVDVFYPLFDLTYENIFDLTGKGDCFKPDGYSYWTRFLRLKNQETTSSIVTSTTLKTSTTTETPSTTSSASTSSELITNSASYTITSVTRTSPGTTSTKNATASATTTRSTSSPSPTPTPGSASRTETGMVGAIVAGVIAALLV